MAEYELSLTDNAIIILLFREELILVYDNKYVELLHRLADAKGPSGFEDETIAVTRDAVKDFARVEEDCMRNLYIYPEYNTGDRPVVMLDAHSDEVGFMVHSIRPDGTLRVVNLGRWTNSTLPASKVKVRNSEGNWISGVFVNKPAHFRTVSDNTAEVKISDLAIDIGACSSQEAADVFHIRIGEPVVSAAIFEFDSENGLFFGKSFDCRIGCAALIQTLRNLSEVPLEVDVVGVLSSQEEIGERGASLSVKHVNPDAAICFEGCPADDTFTEPYAIQTALKKGPMFRHMDVSVICSPRFQRFVLKLARDGSFKVQESVREGGGNDAAVIMNHGNGVPVVTAGIPVRYIHSMNCIASYDDLCATSDLITEIVRQLNSDIIAGF